MGKNQIFGSSSVRFFDDKGSVWFGSLHICTFFFSFPVRVRFGLVLGKNAVLVRFVLAGFGFFPISTITVTDKPVQVHNSESLTCDFVCGGHVQRRLPRRVDDVHVGAQFEKDLCVVDLTQPGGRV